MNQKNSVEGATRKQLTMAINSFANLIPEVVVTAAQTAVRRATQAANFIASPEELEAAFVKVSSFFKTENLCDFFSPQLKAAFLMRRLSALNPK